MLTPAELTIARAITAPPNAELQAYAKDAGRAANLALATILNDPTKVWIKQSVLALPAATQSSINGLMLYGPDLNNVRGYIAFAINGAPVTAVAAP